MKLALVGVGGAGGRIVDTVRTLEGETDRPLCHGHALACSVSRTVPDELDNVPQGRQVTIGDTHPDVTDHGTDGDPALAVEITRNDRPELHRAFDAIRMHELDGVLVVGGLGGGTGSGTTAVIVEELQELYDKPVYLLGVLPGDHEGGRPALNAARALRSVVPAADSTLLFDNDSWVDADADGDDDAYDRANRKLASRLLTLFGVGDSGAATVGAHTMDASDIVRTLAPGGVSTIGYASTGVDGPDGLLSWLRSLLFGDGDGDGDRTTDAVKVKGLIRRAVDSRLTLPCDVASAERVLVVLSGPPEELSRRGFESARQWIETETDTVDVLAGDDPREEASRITAAVLLANVTDVPRIDALQSQAVEFQQGLDGRASSPEDTG